ncbi:MAG TPA: serine/threonine-protein kinase [Thermoleophilaceae bacterium]
MISHGDRGIVYRAEELALQRPVAIKLLLPEFSQDERFRERFRRESRIAAAIDHPNVLPVFDAGEEGGVLYITTRLVDGTDLKSMIAADGHVEPARAGRIVSQVGAGLDAAHARGMLHRDVKPSNVLIARRDHVYLSGFGLAKRADSTGDMTRHGSVVARARYLAPEQVRHERVDARADVYALGCVLFEALTGETPFARYREGPEALAHVDAQPPAPSERRLDVPREFDEVVRRALAKDPDERYPSAGDLGQAALVAAGGLDRASPWSVVGTGDAAPSRAGRLAGSRAALSHATSSDGTPAARLDVLRWTIALAGLVIVAVGMVAALHGISTL